jgi:3-oxoacyl-[acyl-carrier protein] reductase
MGVYLIAGGSRGIGWELARQLSAADHDVFVMARSPEPEESLPDVKFLQCDLSQESLPDLDLPEAFDGLAYCPGTINLRSFRSLKLDDFRQDFEINVMGAVRLLQKYFKRLGNGELPSSVVLFSTVAVARGLPMHASIASSKGAIEALVRSLAAEWAPRIRVNAVAPALTDTPLAARLLSSDERRAALAETYPLRRLGQASDIARAAYYLLTTDSDWVTGQVLAVDGGMSRLSSPSAK